MEARKKVFFLFYLAAGILLGGFIPSCAAASRPLRLDDGRDAVVAVNIAGEWEPWFVGYGTFPFRSRL